MYSTGVCYVLFRWPGGRNCYCVWLFWCSVICSAGQRATVQRESELGVRVQSDFLSPSPHSGGVQFSEAGQRGTDNPLSSPDCPLYSSDVCFSSWTKPNGYRWAQDRLDDGGVELFQQLLWQVELLQLVEEIQPLLGLFTIESMWMSHFRSWEMVLPRNLNDSTAVTVLFMMVSGGRAGGFLLKSTIIFTVLSALSSRLLRLHRQPAP